MNNKGQVLVMFVLLLPVLFLIIYFLITETYIKNEENELNRTVKRLCNYYKKNNDIEKLIEYGNKIDKDIIITIKEKDNSIEIKLIKEKELFNKKNKIKTQILCK